MQIIFKFLWSFLNDLNVDTATSETIIAVVLFSIVLLILLFFILKGEIKLFKKFNIPGLFAIIPGINIICLIKISGISWYWFFVILFGTIYDIANYYLKINMNFLSIISIVITYFGYAIVSYNLKLKFHKDDTWMFGAVLLNDIMWSILGYSKDVVDNNVVVNKNSFLDKKTISNNVNEVEVLDIDNKGQF